MWLFADSIVLLTCLVSAEIPNWIQCLPNGKYTIPDDLYCDKYYECENGRAIDKLCDDGFGFVPYGSCKLLYQVECGPRKLLQPPKGTGQCPRLYGVFASAEGCGRFVKCYKGESEKDACPKGQMFDDIKIQCRFPTDEEKRFCSKIWSSS